MVIIGRMTRVLRHSAGPSHRLADRARLAHIDDLSPARAALRNLSAPDRS